MREESGTFQELGAGASAGADLDGGPARAGGGRDPRSGRAVSADDDGAGYAFVLEPRTSGRILDLALDLARERFGLYVVVATVLWLSVRALQPFIGQHLFAQRVATAPLAAFGIFMVDITALVLMHQLTLVVMALLVWPTIDRSAGDGKVHVWAAIRRALFCLPAILLLQILTALAGLSAFLCSCGILYPYVLWKFTLAPTCFAIERRGFFASLSRSFQLTSLERFSWDAFAGFLRFLAVLGAAGIASGMFSTLGSIGDNPDARARILDVTSMSPGVFDLVLIGVSSLFNGVASALLGVTLLAYYVDCRVRRDGLDLRRRLVALGRAHPIPTNAAGAGAAPGRASAASPSVPAVPPAPPISSGEPPAPDSPPATDVVPPPPPPPRAAHEPPQSS